MKVRTINQNLNLVDLTILRVRGIGGTLFMGMNLLKKDHKMTKVKHHFLLTIKFLKWSFLEKEKINLMIVSQLLGLFPRLNNKSKLKNLFLKLEISNLARNLVLENSVRFS